MLVSSVGLLNGEKQETAARLSMFQISMTPPHTPNLVHLAPYPSRLASWEFVTPIRHLHLLSPQNSFRYFH
jgi:hypothetical protein